MSIGACGAFVHGLEDEFMAVRSQSIKSLAKLSVNNSKLASLALDYLVKTILYETCTIETLLLHGCPCILQLGCPCASIFRCKLCEYPSWLGSAASPKRFFRPVCEVYVAAKGQFYKRIFIFDDVFLVFGFMFQFLFSVL